MSVDAGGGPDLVACLGDCRDVLVLSSPEVSAETVADLGFPAGSEVQGLHRRPPATRDRGAVILVATDLVDLRRALSGLNNLGAAPVTGVLFTRLVPRLPAIPHRPQWPPLAGTLVSKGFPRCVILTFEDPAPVRQVLVELGRTAAPSARLSAAWPALGVRRDEPWRWPSADPSATVAMRRRLLSQESDAPPDVVLVGAELAEDPAFPADDHPVLGRPTRARVVEPDVGWAAWGEMAASEQSAAMARSGVVSLGPVDEHVLNPIGFERDPAGGRGRLVGIPGGWCLIDDQGATLTTLDQRLSDADVPLLRDLSDVAVDWTGGAGPQAVCRLVVALAAVGVPLTAPQVPDWARSLLDPALVAVLDDPGAVGGGRLDREERSVRLRRAALGAHASGPWRRRVARDVGVQASPEPGVSIVLVTRRPEMLPFALGQVERQHGADLELVLATHGFRPEESVVRDFGDRWGRPLTVLPADGSTPFGQVLDGACRRTTGDVVLKMDDDDWYGPDFVTDLLLARGYSGADVVGCAAELTYLEQLRKTVRSAAPSEAYLPIVAGGTLMVDRSVLRSVGGYRHTRKYVDANLLSAVRHAGGSIYRSHGLGYVLRRRAEGHTWDPGLDYFTTAERARWQWEGFAPSALLAVDDRDRPGSATAP